MSGLRSQTISPIVVWTASRVRALTCIFFLLNFAIAFVALPALVGAAYHPNAFYAPYAPPIAAISAPMTAIALLMAIGFLVERRRTSRSYQATVFLRVVVAEAILLLLVFLLARPAPPQLAQLIGATQ